MKKSLLVTLPVAAFVAGMAVVPSVFADEPNCNDISDATALGAALSQCETINLKAGAQISVEELLNVNAKDVTLNLNGATVTRTNEEGNSVFNVENQSLTVNGPGKIVYSEKGVGPTRAITAGENGTVTVNGGAELVGDNGIAVWGAGAKVYFKDGTITATENGINGNGAESSDSTIEISGGTINAGAAVVYMPQSGNLNITGGTQTGYIGVVTRAGTVNITGGTLKATGDEPMQIGDADVEFPGGVAVIVDSQTPGYDTGTPKATIGAGATIEAANTEEGAVLAYENAEGAAEEITIEKGATFLGAAPKAAYLDSMVIGPNNKVMTQAEADKMAEELANQGKTENPDTADSIALYATIAAVALVGLGATAVIAKKARR